MQLGGACTLGAFFPKKQILVPRFNFLLKKFLITFIWVTVVTWTIQVSSVRFCGTGSACRIACPAEALEEEM